MPGPLDSQQGTQGPVDGPVQASGIVELDRLCDQFEARWKTGEQPDIERLLAETHGLPVDELFRQLLLVELAYRRRRGEQPRIEEYLDRFSAFAGVLSGVFQQGI